MQIPKIRKDISEFLDTCIEAHNVFLAQIQKVVSEVNTLKYQAVSKYRITSDEFRTRTRNTLLAKIETTRTLYEHKLEELRIEYAEMMKEHRQLNNDWKVKKNWEAFKADYLQLTHEVIEEKVAFRQTLEKQCAEEVKEALDLLNRFDALFPDEEVKHKKELVSARDFLLLLTQENADKIMSFVMDMDRIVF